MLGTAFLRNISSRTSGLVLLLLWIGFLAACRDNVVQTNSTSPEAAKENGSVGMAAGPPRRLLHEPAMAVVGETPAEALPIWRQYRADRPVLVLFANAPFAAEIPAAVADEAERLVSSGTAAEIVRRASRPTANPVMLPQMAVTGALQGELVAGVVWVIPSDTPVAEINFDEFREELIRYGVPAEDVHKLQKTAGAISGKLYERPFRAVTLAQLPDLTGDLLVHVDLGFFRPLYVHEIRTPIYKILYERLKSIRQKDWRAFAVTISTSNLTGELPLETRFLANDLKKIVACPVLLNEPLPETWEYRGEALYLANFFQKEGIRDRYRAILAQNPGDASAYYALFQIERQLNGRYRPLDTLAEAVSRDPGYGHAYLDLAQHAAEKKNLKAAGEMLKKAAALFPDNPFILLHLAKLQEDTGEKDLAAATYRQLQQLQWSPVYYPQMPAEIGRLAERQQ